MLHGKYGNSIIKISPMDIATFYKNKKSLIQDIPDSKDLG